MKKIIIPPYLSNGSHIGITCPAGYMETDKATSCINSLQSWGYEVMVGKTLGSSSVNYFSGTDEERINEFQAMLDDKSIEAILFARGGYGIGRIIDKINFKKFIRRPKWLIGFSDITVLHSHILNNFKIASLHAPMAAAFNEGQNEYITSLKNALSGQKTVYTCIPHSFNKFGKAKGQLVGGNLALLAHITGTPSDFKTKNKILFLEDIGEYLYNIDRMLYQLKRSGKLKGIAGLIFGGFTDMKDTERPFGKSIEEILKEISADCDIPVCFNFPVSHGKENMALKIGCEYSLLVNENKVELKEL